MFQQTYLSAQFGETAYLVLFDREGTQMWIRLCLLFLSCYLFWCVGFYFNQQNKLVICLFEYIVFVESFLQHYIIWYLDLQINFKFLYFIIAVSKSF